MADGHIHAFHILALLVNDGIQGNRRLACLTVPDDEFALSSSDGHHGVNSLDSCLQRSIHGFPGDNAAGHSLNLTIFVVLHRTLAVDGLPQRVHNTSQHGVAHRDLHYPAGSLNRIAFVNVFMIAEKYRTHVVLFQVHHHAVNLAWEFQQFALHGILQTMHTGDAVRHLNDRTHIRYIKLRRIPLNLFLDYGTYFFWSQIHRLVRTFLPVGLTQLDL